MCAMVDRYQHQQGPITSGYISNSDIHQRERQEQIKWEQQREYEDMMNKHNPNSNQGEVTGLSLPLKDREGFRQYLSDERHRDYNMILNEKQTLENKRKEEMYWNAQNYRPSQPPVTTYDHKQIAKEKALEKQNDYNEFLDNPSMSYRQQEDRKKMLSRERNNEYNEFLEQKKEKENARRLRPPPTPPGGLNIMTEQERKQVAQAKKAAYRDDLLKLEQEQMYQKAKQNGDIHVMSYNQSPPRSPPRGRPPVHPDSARRRGLPSNERMEPMEQKQQVPSFSNEGQQEQYFKQAPSHQSYDSQQNIDVQTPKDRRPQDEMKTGFFDERRVDPPNRDHRREDYPKHLAELQRQDDLKHQKLEEMRHAPRAEVKKGDYYNADTYEQKRLSLNSEKQKEYQDRLTKLKENEGGKTRNEEKEDFVTQRQKALAQERNKEYNEFLDHKSNRPSHRLVTPEDLQGLPLNQRKYDQQKRAQVIERNKEYNAHLIERGEKFTVDDEMLTRRDLTLKNYMDKQLRSEMHDKFRDLPTHEPEPDPEQLGLPIGQFRYKDWNKHQRDQLSKEYNEQKQASKPPRRAPEMANSGTIGFVAGLGQYEKERERLNVQKKDAYNKFLDEKNYGRDGYPKDSHYWASGKVPPESWFKADNSTFNRSSSREQPRSRHSNERDNLQRDRPRSFDRRPSPSYNEILESKRRQEANYRRDDPEYSRSGGQQYGAGPDYTRSGGQQYGPGPDHSRSGGQQYGPGPDYSRSGGQQYGPGPDYSRPSYGQTNGYGRYD